MDAYQQCFIENLKYYRKQAGYSQARLAELCDVSNGTIGNIECGVTKPSFDLLILMAQVLRIQPEQLFHLDAAVAPVLPASQNLTAVQSDRLRRELSQAIDAVLDKMQASGKGLVFGK